MGRKKNRPQVPYSDPRGRTRRQPSTEEQPATASETDYSYVVRDMRRIAILGTLLLAAQFVLKFYMG